jgi:hypothetical protein
VAKKEEIKKQGHKGSEEGPDTFSSYPANTGIYDISNVFIVEI